MERYLLHFVSLACGVAPLVACNVGGQMPEFEPRAIGGAGGAASSPATPTAGEAGATFTDTSEVGLPFAVDLAFSPTGLMGDAIMRGLVDDPNSCLPRLDGSQGNCHSFLYPGALDPSDWVGLYWLFGYENWGQQPGAKIQPSANQVSFLAASDDPTVTFAFFVGGVSSEQAYEDRFRNELKTQLSTELRRFVIDLSDVDYSAGVLGGFGWSASSSKPFKLWIDDVRWE